MELVKNKGSLKNFLISILAGTVIITNSSKAEKSHEDYVREDSIITMREVQKYEPYIKQLSAYISEKKLREILFLLFTNYKMGELTFALMEDLFKIGKPAEPLLRKIIEDHSAKDFRIAQYKEELESLANLIEVKENNNAPMQEEYKNYEKGPIIYDIGEWIKVANENYSLEYRVNDIYKRRMGWHEMWIERFGNTEGLHPEDIEAMKQRYYDIGIVELEVRGTSSILEDVSMNHFKIYYPFSCEPFLEKTILKMLNGTDNIERRVSRNRSAFFIVPFKIYTNVESSYQGAPTNFRFGTKLDGGKTLVEGSFE